MNEISKSWYSITNWNRVIFDTDDKAEARLALREGKEVTKTTRRTFVSGPTYVYLTVVTDIKKAKDL